MLDLSDHIRGCLSQILHSVVKLAIRHAVPWREFYEMSRRIYVQEGKEHLRKGGSKVNIMRVSAATGIRRDDVSRLWDAEEEEFVYNCTAARVISMWIESKEFRSKRGPKELSYGGTDSEFSQLVHSITNLHSPKSVLAHLLSAQLVEKNEETVRLKKIAYVPDSIPSEGLAMLAVDVEDLIESVHQNLFDDPDKPNLHLTTEFLNLNKADKEAIEDWILKKGTRFHKEVRSYLSKYSSRNTRSSSSNENHRLRVVVGTFGRTSQELDQD